MKITRKQLMMCIIGFIGINVLFIIGIIIFTSGKAATPSSKEEWVINAPEASEKNSEIEEVEKQYAVLVTDAEVEDADSGLFKEEEKTLSEAENYQVIYMALIPGTYQAEDGMVFIFGTDGTFEGYFNAENTNVKQYKYEITGKIGVESFIKISNPTYTESVTYPLEITTDGKIYMYYSEEKYIELGI